MEKPKYQGLERAFEILASLPEDFMSGGRQDLSPQNRGNEDGSHDDVGSER